jgi:hypothetical protein
MRRFARRSPITVESPWERYLQAHVNSESTIW